jgi:hypothetical protein
MNRRIFSLALALAVSLGLVGSVTYPANAQLTEIIRFTSPTGNIDCEMYGIDGSPSAGCLVENATWKVSPKKPADCDLDWSPTEVYLSVEGKPAVSVGSCRGDIGPLCSPAGNPDSCVVLPYGKSKSLGIITCTSAKTGITCVTTKGAKRGFTVNKSGYKTR